MKTIESWVLRVADSDFTWIGLGWLRPAKEQRLGAGYILFSSIILGLPGVVTGIGTIFSLFGRVPLSVCLMVFLVVTLIELLLHLPFAHYWNKRAETLSEVQR